MMYKYFKEKLFIDHLQECEGQLSHFINQI